MTAAADIKRTFNKARLLALAQAEGLATRAGRIQCPRRCSDDPRAAAVTDSPDGALWNCHRCAAGGSVIDLVAATRGLTVDEVLARAEEFFSAAALPPPKLHVVKPPMNGALLWPRLAEHDPAAETYLKSRGLEAAASLVRFNTGGAGDGWLSRLAAQGYRLAVPLRDTTGNVLDFQLRSVSPGVSGREAKRSLCGERPKGTAFGAPHLAQGGGRVYIAEGMADTLSLLVAGAVALGAPGVDQLRHLTKLIPAKADVVLCPQNDLGEQSQKAFAELARRLREAKCTVRQLSTPEAWKDLAEWLQSVGTQAFTEAISNPPELPEPEQERVDVPALVLGRPTTDTGNAERLVAQHGKDLRFSRALGWLVWDGKCWAHDDTDEVGRRAKATVRSIYAEAAASEDGDERRRLIDHAYKSESASKRRALVELAAMEEGIPVRPAELDADPWLFNCQNGTLDLRPPVTLRPHRREDMQSKLAPVNYDPAASCPGWLKFLEEVQPDPEIRAFLQRFIGYALTGAIREHLFLVNYGVGRNGKGVFIDTLLALFGGYGRQVPTELLMAKHGEVHPTEKTELLGRRLAAASETEEGKSLNVALVKALTGGDTISARKMHQDFFTFQPTHKLLLSTNHRPRIRETKDAIWQRVKLVPWTQSFPDGDPRTNPTLKLELRQEFAGILRWAVEGCVAWQASGLQPPAAIRAATDAYRQEEDPVGSFLEDRCILEENARTPVKDLRAAFEQWSEEQGDQYPLGGRAFNERLEARGCRRTTSWLCGLQVKAWIGVGLMQQQAQAPQAQEDRYQEDRYQ